MIAKGWSSLPRGKRDVMQVLTFGGSQEVSAKDYDIADLASMVECAVRGKTMLYVCNSDKLNEDDNAKSVISAGGKKNVVFK